MLQRSPEGHHVLLVPPHGVGAGQQVDSARGAVTPVHQLLLRPPGPDTQWRLVTQSLASILASPGPQLVCGAGKVAARCLEAD